LLNGWRRRGHVLHLFGLVALPMAMLYRDNSGRRDPVWQKWGRQWARPSIAASKAEKI
jgi:hypothetical protein